MNTTPGSCLCREFCSVRSYHKRDLTSQLPCTNGEEFCLTVLDQHGCWFPHSVSSAGRCSTKLTAQLKLPKTHLPAYKSVCTCLHLCLCCAHECVYTCICVHARMYMSTCMYTCVCIYVCTCICMYECMCIYVCTCVYTCVYMYVCVSVFVCMHMYVHTHRVIHTSESLFM